MSRYPTKSVAMTLPKVLGLGLDGLAWFDSLPKGGFQCNQIDWPSDSGSSSAPELWKESIGRRAWAPAGCITVCLSSSLVRHWQQTLPIRTRSLAELHSVACARANLLFGRLPAESWLVSGEWNFRRPFVCTALASGWAPLLKAIQQTHRNAQVVSGLSLVSSHCHDALPIEGWLAIVSEDRVHLMHRTDGFATSLRSVQLPKFETQAAFEAAVLQEWHREKVRTQRTAGALHWFSLPPFGHALPTSTGIAPIPWEPHPALGYFSIGEKSLNLHAVHATGSASFAAFQGLQLLMGRTRNAS